MPTIVELTQDQVEAMIKAFEEVEMLKAYLKELTSENREQRVLQNHYTREETARLLNVKVTFIDRWTKMGKLSPTIVDGERFYTGRDILDFSNKHKQAPKADDEPNGNSVKR